MADLPSASLLDLPVYVSDAVAVFLQTDDAAPQDAPQFLHAYLQRVLAGSHVVGREYAYVGATVWNKLWFSLHVSSAYLLHSDEDGAVGDREVCGEDALQMLRLLCPTFHKAHVLSALRVLHRRPGSRLPNPDVKPASAAWKAPFRLLDLLFTALNLFVFQDVVEVFLGLPPSPTVEALDLQPEQLDTVILDDTVPDLRRRVLDLQDAFKCLDCTLEDLFDVVVSVSTSRTVAAVVLQLNAAVPWRHWAGKAVAWK